MKKSYMNNKNILSEGFFDNIKTFFKLYKQISKNKKITRDPKVKGALKKWEKAAYEARDAVNKARADYNLPPV
jgi:inorganic pyrophosphatase